MSEEPSKHLTLFSSETVNIKKLANLTANTKDYGQITRNTKPHSDPLIGLIISCGPAMLFRSRGSFRINHRNVLTEEAWVNAVPGLSKFLHRTKIANILLHFITLCQEAKLFPYLCTDRMPAIRTVSYQVSYEQKLCRKDDTIQEQRQVLGKTTVLG